MKTRNIIAILGSLALAATFAGCSNPEDARPAPTSNSDGSSELQTLTNGVLTIGTDLTYPPYDMLVDGKPAGFDIDFMTEVAKVLDLEPNFIDTRFAQIVAGIKANRYDVIASTLYISAERAKEVDFIPYFQTGNSIISLAGGDQFATAQELCGKTVGVVTATVIADIMPNAESDRCAENGLGAISVKEFPTDPEASQALLAGQVDAQMTDGAVAKSAVEKTNDRLVISSKELIYPIAVGIGVRKGDTAMVDAITSAIDEMKDNGTYDALLKEYNLEPVDPAVLDESLNRE